MAPRASERDTGAIAARGHSGEDRNLTLRRESARRCDERLTVLSGSKRVELAQDFSVAAKQSRHQDHQQSDHYAFEDDQRFQVILPRSGPTPLESTQVHRR